MIRSTAAMNLSQSNTFQEFQSAVVPGIEGLYRSTLAIFDVALPAGACILVVGAGGGRELETFSTSSRNYRLVGVDPSPEMLALARDVVDQRCLQQRATLHQGVVDDLPENVLYDAATSFLVMHFLEDDGSKQRYLEAIRKRIRLGSPYVHVDVCFDGLDTFSRLQPVYAAHAMLNGLDPNQAVSVSKRVGTMPILSEDALYQHFKQAGFKIVAPFFKGLWYAGWWLEAI